jgi:DNA-binding NarL/FixJ family response regulator
MRPLRFVISGLLRRNAVRDQRTDANVVADAFGRITASLRTADVTGVMSAVSDLARMANEERPMDPHRLIAAVEALPEPEATILREYRSGKSLAAIAAQLGMEKCAVLRSLARTYAGLRMLEPK